MSSELPPPTMLTDEPGLQERLRALLAMIRHGLDEQVVTLTFLDGIGGTLATRLRSAGIMDIEDLAGADLEKVAAVRGISSARATRWIEGAAKLLATRSAFALRETGPKINTVSDCWKSSVDPYRLRRALELSVRRDGDGFTVSGGLDAHRVVLVNGGMRCDCADFAQGHECKHSLAARISCNDTKLMPLISLLSDQDGPAELDLFQLWYDTGRR
jgi:helicase